MRSCAWSGFYTAAQLHRWHQAIARRFSCRDFTAAPDMSQKSTLHYAAARVCLPGVRIHLDGCDSSRLFFSLPFVPAIKGAAQYAALIADMGSPNACLHAGISGEALVLEATSLGLGTCWVAGTYRRSELNIPLTGREKMLAVIPFGVPADPAGASERTRKPLRQLCRDDPAQWPLWAFNAAEAVRAAPSGLNRQPWRFSCTGSTMMLTSRRFGTLDDGIAVLHMECALADAQRAWQFGERARSVLVRSD